MTTYAEQYFATMGTAGGRVARVSVMGADFSGTAQRLYLSDKAASLRWGKKGVDIYTPILASHASAEFWKGDGASDLEDALEELYAASSEQFRMDVRLGPETGEVPVPSDPIYWTGRVLPDVYSDSTMNRPERMEVQAVGGLGKFKEIAFETTDASGNPTPYEDRMSFARATGEIFSKLGNLLPFTAATEIEPYQLATDPGPRYDQIRFDPSVFYDPEEGTPATCYEVLRQMMYASAAQLFQQAGRWHIVQRSLLSRSGGYARDVFDATGTHTGTESVQGPRTVTLGTDVSPSSMEKALYTARERGERTFKPGRSQVSISYEHGPLPGLVGDPSFGTAVNQDDFIAGRTTWEDLIYEGPWEFQQATYQYNSHEAAWLATKEPIGLTRTSDTGTPEFVPNKKYQANRVLRLGPAFSDGGSPNDFSSWVVANGPSGYQQPDTYLEKDQICAFRGQCTIPYSGAGPGDYLEDQLYTPYWRVRVGEYWLQLDGTWVQDAGWTFDLRSEAGVQFFVPPGDEYHDEGLPLDAKGNAVESISAPHPTGGIVELVQVWGVADGPSDYLEPGPVEWDDVSLDVVRADGKAPTSTKTAIRLEGKAEPEKDEVELAFGEGPTRNTPARLTVPDGLGGELFATDWKRTSYTSSEEANDQTHASAIAQAWLRGQTHPLTIRQETYRALDIQLGQALSLGGVNLAPSYLAKDLYHLSDEVELVEVAYDETATLSSVQTAKEDGTYTRDFEGESLERQQRLSRGAQRVATLTGYLASQNPLTTLTAEVSGSVTTLPVAAAGSPVLKSGNAVVVVDSDTGRPVEMTIASGETTDDTDLEVQSVSLSEPLASGSGVYFGHRDLLDLVRSLEDTQGQQGTTLTDHETRISSLEGGGGGGGGTNVGIQVYASGIANISSGSSETIVSPSLPANFDLNDRHIQATPMTEPDGFSSWHVGDVNGLAGDGTFKVLLNQNTASQQSFAWQIFSAVSGFGDYLTNQTAALLIPERMSSVYNDGDSVTTLEDYSSAENDFTGTNPPVFRPSQSAFNGKSAVEFIGRSQKVAAPGPLFGPGNHRIYMVIKVLEEGTLHDVMGQDADENFFANINGSGPDMDIGNWGGSTMNVADVGLSTFCLEIERTSNGRGRIWINGGLDREIHNWTADLSKNSGPFTLGDTYGNNICAFYKLAHFQFEKGPSYESNVRKIRANISEDYGITL